MHTTPANLASIAYVGVFASVVAFSTWNSGIRRVGAQVAGQFIHLMPAFSALLAVIFLHERLQTFHIGHRPDCGWHPLHHPAPRNIKGGSHLYKQVNTDEGQ